jgi:PAS domain S-box-containing protein
MRNSAFDASIERPGGSPADRSDAVPRYVPAAIHACAAISFTIGVVHLVAWAAGVVPRWSAAGVITVKTNMALSQVLGATALYLLTKGRGGKLGRGAGMAAASLVAAVGALTLVQHAFSVDLGIDQLLATEPPGAAATASPNRIGPPGSLSLAMLGTGLLALALRRGWAVYFGLATVVVVLVPAVGFLKGLAPLYGTPRVTGIAWPTVIALSSLATGLVLACGERGGPVVLWRADQGGVLLRRMLPATVLGPLVLVFLTARGRDLGLYDEPFETGLFALAVLLFFALVLWRSASLLSAIDAQRVRAVEQHLQEKERLAVTLRSIGDGVVATDRAGRITIWNAGAAALTGWRADEAVGRGLGEVLHLVNELTREPAPNPVDRVLREGVAVGLANHTVLVARDGAERAIADTAAPIRDAGGEVVGVVLVFRDQTDERRAGRALRESEERLRGAMQRLESLLENSPLAVIEWSVDFRVTRWSDEATRVFGWTREETIGRRIDELSWVHPDDAPSVEGVMADMLSGRRPRNVNRNRNLRKDGSVIHCEWYNSTVTDAAGKLTAVLSLVLDVTERTRFEQALVDADRRKSEFLAVLSHELRNPLAPLRNSVFLLERAPAGSEQAVRAKNVIRRQTEHLARLVDGLLDVTRIARGKIELQRARLDLREVVRRVCDDQRGVFEARGVVLDVDAPSPAWIDGDETRIAQIVGNLLQNAAKFSDAGAAVTLHVEARDRTVVIRVRDRGVGMSEELLGRLFEPFVQADGGLARSQGGLGLGLAVVKGLAELHGGSVEAHSAGPGRGSELVVRLPAADPPAVAPVKPRLGSSGRPLDVLLVEDNVDAAETLRDVLEAEGHRVRIAMDGRSGIALARAAAPNVVVCDIGLPDMDGYSVARALRREFPSASLIALTGYAQPSDLALAEQAGFDAHLPKPPPLEILLGMLRAMKVA